MEDSKNGGPNYLAAWRELRSLTQEDVAAKVGTTGSVISLLEKGERGLTLKWIRKLAPALETTPAKLVDPPGQAVVRVPTEDELARMLAAAQDEVGLERLTVGGYSNAVASGLRARLLRYSGVRSSDSDVASEPSKDRDEGAQPHPPTRKSARG